MCERVTMTPIRYTDTRFINILMNRVHPIDDDDFERPSASSSSAAQPDATTIADLPGSIMESIFLMAWATDAGRQRVRTDVLSCAQRFSLTSPLPRPCSASWARAPRGGPSQRPSSWTACGPRRVLETGCGSVIAISCSSS